MITDPGFGDDGWRDYHNLLAELHRRYESAFINCTWQQTRDRIGSFFAQMPHHHRMLVETHLHQEEALEHIDHSPESFLSVLLSLSKTAQVIEFDYFLITTLSHQFLEVAQ